MSDRPAWLDEISPDLRCANCGAAWDKSNVTVVGNREEYWFLRCVCPTCGNQQVGVVGRRPAGTPLPQGALRWFDACLECVRCANCQAKYDRTGVNVVGNRDDYWFLRCTCQSCGTQGVGVVVVREMEIPAEAKLEPGFSGDDVLDAHEALREHRGDLLSLFKPKAGR